MEEATISTIEPQWGNPLKLGKQKDASIPIESNLYYAANEGIRRSIKC
jgi:hypothetical protein